MPGKRISTGRLLGADDARAHIRSRTDRIAIERLQIRRVEPGDSVPDLTELLHRAYRQLADMGFRYWASHQSPEVTARRLARGEGLVGTIDDRIVGTITFVPHTAASGTEWYDRPEVAYVGQFGVEPILQGQGIGSALLAFAEHRAAELGAGELALDTAEPASHLIAFYTRRGYRLVGRHQHDGTNYMSVLMSKTLPGAR